MTPLGLLDWSLASARRMEFDRGWEWAAWAVLFYAQM